MFNSEQTSLTGQLSQDSEQPKDKKIRTEASGDARTKTPSQTKTLAKVIQDLSVQFVPDESRTVPPLTVGQDSGRSKTTNRDPGSVLVQKSVPDPGVRPGTKDRIPPEALPKVKLLELFEHWAFDAKEQIMLDKEAVKEGRGPAILKELTTACENLNEALRLADSKDQSSDKTEKIRVLKKSQKTAPALPDISLTLSKLIGTQTPDAVSPSGDQGQGDGQLSPLSPVLRSNPLSPSFPTLSLVPSPSGLSRRSTRGQPGLPPLSPDFLTSKHGRSPSSVENFRKLKESVPRFYWPEGKPPPTQYISEKITKAELEFSTVSKGSGSSGLTYEEFGKFLQSIGVSVYWKKPFWTSLLGVTTPSSKLDIGPFKYFYHGLISQCPDEASRFLRLVWTARTIVKDSDEKVLRNGSALDKFPIEFKNIVIQMSDLVPMIQDIIDTHPGLGFLREAPEFHSRYVTTVISRIFYKVNRSWTGALTLSEVRRSNLLRIIRRLEEETDINAITDYFSYEHFYVIYCKFWELDKDHDLLIDKIDLTRHNDQALSTLIIDRIFGGTVLRGWDINSGSKPLQGKMTYSDFVWFIISEEDKKDPTAIEYWFRCLDLDGDGILSPYELQYFYREQESRIMGLGIEPLDFANIFCQMVDMLRCSTTGVRLKDLKQNPQLAAAFFNTLFNLDKYLDHEQRDPFASSSAGVIGLEVNDSDVETDWDRFAATEYELLIAEESPNDHAHNDSDFEELPS